MEATTYRWADLGQDNPVDLLHRKKLQGEKMLVAQVSLSKGCYVATHQHDSEQIAIVISGHVRFRIGAEGSPDRRDVELRGGEVIVLPSNVLHGVDALEDTEIIDVLSPIGAMGIDSQRKMEAANR